MLVLAGRHPDTVYDPGAGFMAAADRAFKARDSLACGHLIEALYDYYSLDTRPYPLAGLPSAAAGSASRLQDGLRTVAALAGLFGHAVRDRQDAQRRNFHDPKRWHGVLIALGIAIYTTDETGRLTFYNGAAARLWGWEPPLYHRSWCGAWRLTMPDGSDVGHERCAMLNCLRKRRPIRGVWAFAHQPGGAVIPLAPLPTPVIDAAGALIGAFNVMVDLSGGALSSLP